MNRKIWLFICVIVAFCVLGLFAAPLLSNVCFSQDNDVILIPKDILDKSGKRIAVEFYMQNNTEKAVRVNWSCKGAVNTHIQSCKGTVDIPSLSKIWVATVSQDDFSKPWEPGSLSFEFVPLE